jgi:hypothetical protein
VNLDSAQAWVMIIAAISAALVSAIAAYKAAVTGKKVDEVHTLTNRNFTVQKDEIVSLRAEITALTESAATAEKARSVLAAETAQGAPRIQQP